MSVSGMISLVWEATLPMGWLAVGAECRTSGHFSDHCQPGQEKHTQKGKEQRFLQMCEASSPRSLVIPHF